MSEVITVNSGETVADTVWSSGESITVTSGGSISNIELTFQAEKLTLEAGSNIGGTITVASEVAVLGEINAKDADIVWDISHRKEEEGLLWSDITAAAANSYSITVSANQDKGTYRIAGNAADFSGTITIRNSAGVELGYISLADNVMDFDVTRYTLAVNEQNELTLTVSATITDTSYYVFLYKDNKLVIPLTEGFDLTVTKDGEYDQIVVIENGLAGNVNLQNNAVMTVYAGATAIGVNQDSQGKLRFDYTAGDTTIISGLNVHGSFMVQNDQLLNVCGENVNLSGKLTVVDYHSLGAFSSINGVDISGTFTVSGSATFKNGTNIHDCTISGSNLNFEKGITVTDTVISGGSYHYFRGGEYNNVTVSGNYNYFYSATYNNVTITGTNNYLYGGTYSNVTISGGYIYSNIELEGTLTVNSSLSGSGKIYANGNTINLDLTQRKTTDTGALLAGQNVTDAVFTITLLADQGIGSYVILGSGDTRQEYSFVLKTGDRIIGTLTQDNQSIDAGNYVYTMTSAQKLDISISANADETFNVLFKDKAGIYGHAAELFGAIAGPENYTEITVRSNGLVGDIILQSGGLLELYQSAIAIGVDHKSGGKLRFDYSAGDTTLITGLNQYGMFMVQDDTLMNVIGENVNLSGAVSVQDYYSTGVLNAVDGVAFTGILNTGSQEAVFGKASDSIADVKIANATVSGGKKTFYSVKVSDSVIGGSYNYFRGGEYNNVTINGSSNYCYGGSYSNVTISGGYISGNIALKGTLTVTGNLSVSYTVATNGNTVVLDYSKQKVGCSSMISNIERFTGAVVDGKASSSVIFQVELKDDQTVGDYKLCSGVSKFDDTFQLTIGGTVFATLTGENNSVQYGNYSYTINKVGSDMVLTIGISENADETFNVLCYDKDKNLVYAPEMTTVTIDGSSCAEVTVRSGGVLANAKLQSGLLTVRSGGMAYGLQQTGGNLSFTYNEGDSTLITGLNQYGSFFVQDNKLINVAGYNVTVNGNVQVQDYHASGSFTADGATVTDDFYGSGTFKNSTITNANITGTATVSGNSTVSDSTFAAANFSDGYFDTITVNGTATLNSGTYRDVTLVKSGSIRGRIALEGSLTICNTVTCVSSYSVNGAIYADGNEVNLDITDRSPIDTAMINLDRVYNADLTITIYANQALGTYALGSNAGNLGVGDNTAVWDSVNETWVYTKAIQGDLDGVVTIRNEHGFEVVQCTVNGDTEYFGRYNYRVYTDENNELKLRIGWNNRNDVVFVDDNYNNDTMQTATVISGNGLQTIKALSIHNENDVDYFKFSLDCPGSAANYISIDFKQWAGDLDIDLFDARGNRIDYSHSVTDNETISLQGLSAGDYYLKVYGDNGNTNGYTLTADLPVAPSFKDDYENGNTAESAYYLGVVSSDTVVHAAITEADDVDYFKFVLDRSGTIADSVTLTFDPEYGDLDLYLYDGKGKYLLSKSVNSAGGEETVSFKGLARGSYTLQVVSKDGKTMADYQLDFTIHGDISGNQELDPDKYENNNTLKKAKNLNALNGNNQNKGLTIHSASDVDYFKFKLKKTGSFDDYISITYEAVFGDLDIDILDEKGNVVACSRTIENTDKVSLDGLKAGNYYIKVYGCDGAVNSYTLEHNVSNSAHVSSDAYEGVEYVNKGYIDIRQDQTISNLSISPVNHDDETTADTFKITLDYDAWKSSKIILADYRPDWQGLNYVLKDADGKEIVSGVGAEISLAGLKKGEYYLTVDTPEEDEYSEYSITAQGMPDHQVVVNNNKWSIFIYLAGDNNLEDAYLDELMYMHQKKLPAGVEVYVLFDRAEKDYSDEYDWNGTRVCKIVYNNGFADYIEWMQLGGQNEWDTGDISTLEAFLDWGMEVGSADNYALIMKDHGTSLGFNSKDETSGSVMNVTDIADLLKKSKYDDLNLVAFDQCLMGSDVVITAMEGVVDYVVASEAIGYTPNQLVKYKDLFKSLSADMTPQELAQKIVNACNSSGKRNLTSASFNLANATLSEALNAFAEASSGFTRADWETLCKSFAQANNYGDDICAYSDLGFLLNSIKNNVTISDCLADAVDELYDIVINNLIDSTKMTPSSYGSGLAIFNPVLSDDMMSFYDYYAGVHLDYYATSIGQGAWGDFLYIVGKLAGDCTEYFVDDTTQLTFTDFTFSVVDDAIRINYDLGAFSGNGAEYNGLYLNDEMFFTITLDSEGIASDAICVTADNPKADITLTLVQQVVTSSGEIEFITVGASENGVLSLGGINSGNAGKQTEYFLIISTSAETTCNISFEADWTSGSDYFDYVQSGKKLGKQGNGSLNKATVLAAGNYGGLVTYKGDADYYHLKTVYSSKIDVTVKGYGLTVAEYNADGKLVKMATAKADGIYTITVANGNYLYVEGDADITAGKNNSYSMEINDVLHTYLEVVGGAPDMPKLEIFSNAGAPAREVVFTAITNEGNITSYSLDLKNWITFTETCTVTENGRYYFKSFDTENGVESKYVSVEIDTIDRVAPEAPVVIADSTEATDSNVTLTAVYSEDSAVKEYSLDNVHWNTYTKDIVLEENGTVYFRAFDTAGNVSEITEYRVGNIDKVAPVLEIHRNITVLTCDDVILTATANEGSIEYYDGSNWVKGNIVTATENGIYKFRATDAAGNTAEKEVFVGNIDKVPPVLEITGNPEAWTNKDAVLTASANEDGVIEYWDGTAWITGNTVSATANGIYKFRVTDLAGNVTEKSVEVARIDKEAPPEPVIHADITELTNSNVTVTAEFSNDSVKCEYSRDNENWQSYQGGIIFEQNGNIYFRATDEAGNCSEVAEYEVTNIDKVATDQPVASADITTITNGNVTVTAEFSRESARKEYSLDNIVWAEYTKGIVFEDNGKVYFRSIDAAGNVSEITVYEVTCIDKTAPNEPVAEADITTATKCNVTVTATFSEDSVVKEYSYNKEDWFTCTAGIIFENNGKVYFRGQDEAGNYSKIT
ncbi:MAG: pre-peptidase C-terminal domain-containing protein [Lentisphaeria bacterium]|nr:pre-peptidase C-terminal domain-containing protein [Lentisphaeria bacterium]